MKNSFENQQPVPVEEIPELTYEVNEVKGAQAEIKEVQEQLELVQEKRPARKPETYESATTKKILTSFAAVGTIAGVGAAVHTYETNQPEAIHKKYAEPSFSEGELTGAAIESLERLFPGSHATEDGGWVIPDIDGKPLTLDKYKMEGLVAAVKHIKKEIDKELYFNKQSPQMQNAIKALQPSKIEKAVKETIEIAVRERSTN